MEEMIAFLKKLMDQIDEKAKSLGIENVAIHVHYNNGYKSDDIQCLNSDPAVKADAYKPYWLFYQSRTHGYPWADRTEEINKPVKGKDED